MSAKMPRLQAFTLVELLVVIGIIALLVSILVPALNRARQSAKQVQCLTQLRQLGQVSAMYTNEHRGVLFACYDSAIGKSWPDMLEQYVKKQPTPTSGTYDTNFRSLYVCPNAILNFTNQFPLTYAANCSAHVWLTSTRTRVRVSRIGRPTEVISLIDASQSSGAWTSAGWVDSSDASWFNSLAESGKLIDSAYGNRNDDGVGGYRIRYRHMSNRFAGVLYIDGHASAAEFKTLRYSAFGVSY